MSYTLLNMSYPIARKYHKCIWCGQKILKGVKHHRERSVYDKILQDHRWHIECLTAWEEVSHGGEEEFNAYENERPV